MRFTYIKNSKANTPKRNSKDETHQDETTVCFYDAVPDNEMTEEQMIAEDYYFYQDKE